jgi:hypothetical protein
MKYAKYTNVRRTAALRPENFTAENAGIVAIPCLLFFAPWFSFWSQAALYSTQIMTTETKNKKWDGLKDCMANMAEISAMFPRQNTSTTTLLDWAVRGCFAVGVVGLVKAIGMQSVADISLCLLVSLGAFGLVIYVRSRKA